ncbi:MAG: 5-carboxymethyl-2-hydroxymuconate isomerase [Flavobacteriales bacterium]|nr:5-carboxymethyl-2-hydroxymuconate isomerase [Flavobacteriales bacterium]
MPHFVLEYSEKLLDEDSKSAIMNKILQVAHEAAIFDPGTIKVRLRPHQYYARYEGEPEFVHLLAYIMEGRSEDTRKSLSRALGSVLVRFFSDLDVISVDIREIQKSTYTNKNLLLKEQ